MMIANTGSSSPWTAAAAAAQAQRGFRMARSPGLQAGPARPDIGAAIAGLRQELGNVTTQDGRQGIVGRGGNFQELGAAALRRLNAGVPGAGAGAGAGAGGAAPGGRANATGVLNFGPPMAVPTTADTKPMERPAGRPAVRPSDPVSMNGGGLNAGGVPPAILDRIRQLQLGGPGGQLQPLDFPPTGPAIEPLPGPPPPAPAPNVGGVGVPGLDAATVLPPMDAAVDPWAGGAAGGQGGVVGMNGGGFGAQGPAGRFAMPRNPRFGPGAGGGGGRYADLVSAAMYR